MDANGMSTALMSLIAREEDDITTVTMVATAPEPIRKKRKKQDFPEELLFLSSHNLHKFIKDRLETDR
jgi:hypothetical protein